MKNPKPCPFCGSDKIEITKIAANTWSIACVNPDCKIKPFANDFDPKHKVINAWNNRYRDRQVAVYDPLNSDCDLSNKCPYLIAPCEVCEH
jgi:hypothetical protein